MALSAQLHEVSVNDVLPYKWNYNCTCMACYYCVLEF